ncbi:hypothetical protein HPB52_009632 [Rhipicephalus sanguineus]|uniref:BTB domain-containing protein n=1 Tax=Rhipicephalus sanguineus TaxID=34632 RepID=A0A9D4SSJ4_RHISA|nr:hypothetical protein HPB52_009632 [Rhipicephalus sanguineus]
MGRLHTLRVISREIDQIDAETAEVRAEFGWNGVSSATFGNDQFSLSESFESGDLADVEILAESSYFPGQRATFKAHKMILAVQNEVFRAIFFGEFAKEGCTLIANLHPEGVRGLLRYFYSGRLEVGTVHHAACTRTAAARCRIPQLEEECHNFMNYRMTPDDVCPFLDYILAVGEEALAAPATTVIVKKSLKVLSSATFKSCTEATVKYVLKHAANVSEASVLQAVYAWGQQRLMRMQQTGGHEGEQVDFRTVVLPLIPELRFLALTPKEFVDGPNAWGFLTDAEARAILSNIVKDGSMPMPAGLCEIRKARA